MIRFEGDQSQAVFKKKEVDQVMPRIMTQYGITQPNRTELGNRRLAKGSYQQEGESR